MRWRRDGRRGGSSGAAAVALATVAVLTPWTIYAPAERGRSTPVSSGGASNLYVGTYLPGDGTMFGLKRAQGFSANTPQKKVLDAVAARRPERDRDAALRGAALANVREYVAGDPVGFAGLALRKVDRLWLGYTLGTHRNPRGAVTVFHLVLVGLSFGGLALALVRRLDPAFWVPAVAVLYVIARERRARLRGAPQPAGARSPGRGRRRGPGARRSALPRLTAAMRAGGSLVRRS